MSDATSDLVLREDSDGLCTLTLNRPEKLNAFTPTLFKAFAAHIKALAKEGDTVGCVILKGAGKGFCGGHDLGEVISAADSLGWLRYESSILEKLNALPQPVIAAVHGTCMTAGI